MPIDFEMILSASPPIFSPASFMSFGYNGHFNDHHRRNGDHDALDSAFAAALSLEDRVEGAKKRVCFADDKGLALEHVKVMSEPSNCPPRWTDEFLAQIVKGVKPNPMLDTRWEAMFPQPASDYLAFRDKVQKNRVSLENVIIRDGEATVTGTIKVRNMSFDKEVFVRVTFDRWATSDDVPATYVPSGQAGSSQVDTFSFAFEVPSSVIKSEELEFCVCFRCKGSEYWDNNDGANYKISVQKQKAAPNSPVTYNKQFSDALKVDIQAWSEFASWNHLITEGPYW